MSDTDNDQYRYKKEPYLTPNGADTALFIMKGDKPRN